MAYLIIFTESDYEYNGGDVFEAVDPLFSLRSLTAHVKHSKVHALQRKVDLDNTGGAYARTQNVLIVRIEARLTHYVHLVQKVLGRVVHLILVAPLEAHLHARIRPQPLHGGEQFRAEWFRVNHLIDHVKD